jgi:hypothetical protein
MLPRLFARRKGLERQSGADGIGNSSIARGQPRVRQRP